MNKMVHEITPQIVEIVTIRVWVTYIQNDTCLETHMGGHATIGV
jgi:hypothetical protein